MSHILQVKDYYSILGVAPDATEAQIQEAYHNLAVQHHPKKTSQETLQAHKKFKDLNEALHILSNKNKRTHYDQLINNQFSLHQAEETFKKFYREFGVQNQDQKDFFDETYPHTTKDYYHVLGVSRNATMEQIQNAYRKLALAYHPKKNLSNQEAKHKFIEVNEAYDALSCDKKRNSYNQVIFKTLEPSKAVEIFDQFFFDKNFKSPEEQHFFRPLIQKKWLNRLDKLMHDDHHIPNHQNGQIRRFHQIYENKNGVQCKKVVKQHKKLKDGKVHAQITQEYTLPNGDKEVRQTIKEGDRVDKKVYHLKKDQQIPLQIEKTHHAEPIQLEKRSSQTHQNKISHQIENANENDSKVLRNQFSKSSRKMENGNEIASENVAVPSNQSNQKQVENGHQTEVQHTI